MPSSTPNPRKESHPGTIRKTRAYRSRKHGSDRLGCNPAWLLGQDDGLTAAVNDFTLTGITAAHETVETDEQGRHKYLGYVVRFGPWTPYHSSDTVWHDGLVEKLRPLHVDLALLLINGSALERRVAGNLNGVEASTLAHAIGARMVIPCHFEMFAFNTASPDGFVAEARRHGQPYAVLRNGEQWSHEKLSTV